MSIPPKLYANDPYATYARTGDLGLVETLEDVRRLLNDVFDKGLRLPARYFGGPARVP